MVNKFGQNNIFLSSKEQQNMYSNIISYIFCGVSSHRFGIKSGLVVVLRRHSLTVDLRKNM